MPKTIPTRRKLLVYLVDDDTTYLLMLKETLLQKLGERIDIRIFHKASNALKEMKKRKPQVMILDYYLSEDEDPSTTGLQVLTKVVPKYPKTKVIIMSGQEEMQVAIDALEAGAYDYIIKNEKALYRAVFDVQNILKGLDEERFHRRQKKILFLVGAAIAGLIATVFMSIKITGLM